MRWSDVPPRRRISGTDWTGSYGAVLAVLFAVVLIAEMAIMAPGALDDAFIIFRYGDNWAHGCGLVWNCGEAPVEGYTTTLGVIAATLSIRAGIHPLVTAKALGGLALLFTAGLILFAARVLTPADRLAAMLFLVWSPDLPYYAMSGMENVWPVPIITVFVIRHLSVKPFTRWTYAWMGVLSALVCYIRPEGHLIAGAIIMLHAWRAWCKRSVSVTKLGLLIAPCLVFVGALHIARYWWFGGLLPNAFYAKHTGGSLFDTWFSGATYLGDRFFPIYAIPWLLAIVALTRRRRDISLVWLVLLLAFPLYVIVVGGDDPSAFAGARLLIPIVPVLSLYAAFGLTVFAPRRRGAALLGVITVGLCLNATWYLATVKALYGLSTLSTGVQQQMRTRALGSLQPTMLPLSRYFLDTLTPGQTIAVPWTGRVPYETRLPTIDLLGLNDKHIASQPKRQRGVDVKYDVPYVLAKRPQIICENVRIRGLSMAELARLGDSELVGRGAFKIGQRELLRSPILQAEYRLDEAAPVDGCFRRINEHLLAK